ncbi:hypothetical protein CVT24_012401 [Panaeolus cyanescens]|uniref:Uncharacterized protein n=1 Tax=Panaeolus cyanescens TaxID=181874 RepID=A0A409YJC3_9AGAR|nr:hypothetical protein CVT24_012401 [Panaeolus cyanescens]
MPGLPHQGFILHPPSVPAHGGIAYSLSVLEDAPSPVPSSGSSSSSGSSPQMLPHNVPGFSRVVLTGSSENRGPQVPRRNSINPYPSPHEGPCSPTRSRFSPASPPIEHMGYRNTGQGSVVRSDRTIRSSRRPSLAQDENNPAVGSQMRRPRAYSYIPAHYDVVPAGIFGDYSMPPHLHRVLLFEKGSQELGVSVGSLNSPRPVAVTGDWLFQGTSERQIDIRLSWPGFTYVVSRRLNIAAFVNAHAQQPYNTLAEVLAKYLVEFAADLQKHSPHRSDYPRLSLKSGPTTIGVNDLYIGGLYCTTNSKWEIQLLIPKYRSS